MGRQGRPMAGKHYDVKDLKLAAIGKKRIDWADQHMPVVRKIRDRFAKEKPLRGITPCACLHDTTATANLIRTLKAARATVALSAPSQSSTQPDVAAARAQRED